MSTVDVDRKTRLIDELDLEPIAFKLVHPEPDETSMSVEQADDLIAKYRRFLKLCAMYPERSIVPSKEIDQVWHAHILDTAKYAADCDAIFGFLLHHFPYFGLRGAADLEHLHGEATETRRLYMQHFGGDMFDGSIKNVDSSCSSAPSCQGDCSPSCAPSGVVRPSLGVRPRLTRS